MAVTEVTSENWFSRILGSIGGIFFGILIFLIAVPVLFWNEGRTVKTARALAEGASSVVTVSADSVDAGKEGRLVHLTGPGTTTATLSDPTFALSRQALKLARDVEMYQWKENTKTETRKKVGGGEEKVTTYSYEKVWDDDVLSSGSFHESGHDNPSSMPFESQTWTADPVTVGAFTLAPTLVDQLSGYQPLPATQDQIVALDLEKQARARVESGQVYLKVSAASAAGPEIGDTRVGFRVIEPQTISVVAKQTGAGLGPYQTTQKGYDVELLAMGAATADEMFQAAEAQNSLIKWILRVVGFVMMFIGASMVGRPFVVVAEFIPFLGSLVSIGVGLFAFLISAITWFVVVGVAWIVYRPLLGLLLLSAAAAAFALLVIAAFTLGRRHLAQKKQAAA